MTWTLKNKTVKNTKKFQFFTFFNSSGLYVQGGHVKIFKVAT